MSHEPKITRLVSSEGKTRTFEYDDGTIETRNGGSASWRNNNPGNLKFEFARSADRTVHSRRTRDQALVDARRAFNGVVGLDQWGNAVFESVQAGEAAQLKLLTGRFRAQTVEQLVEGYSRRDYSGGTHHARQVASIHRTAKALGVDLHGKAVCEMSAPERHALARGIQKFEGFRVGETDRAAPGVAVTSVPAGPGAIYAEAELHFFRSVEAFEYGRPDSTKPGRDRSRTEQDLDHDGKLGVDCSAFVWRALKNAGYGVPGDDAGSFSTHTLFAGSSVTPYGRAHFDVIAARDARMPNGSLSRGDLLLFSNEDGQHVGIFKGYDASGHIQFIGSQSSTGPETVTVKPHGYWDGATTHIVGALRAKAEFQTHAPLHASASTVHESPHAIAGPHRAGREQDPARPGQEYDEHLHLHLQRHPHHRPDPVVRADQHALNVLGARDAKGMPLVEDGIAGQRTHEAVKAFQQDHRVRMTGHVGTETRQLLEAAHGLRITDPRHPDYSTFERTLALVEAAERARGVTPGLHSANLAAALVVQARDAGLERIDRVDFGEPPRFARAVQVTPGAARETERIATVETRVAAAQSLHASSDLLARLSPAAPALDMDVRSRAPALTL